ncbi:hypothetical protein P8452_03731 [Trifolium repens]|nr:hypothetical protein P8452_03731 [Trifolium repens]
MHGLAKGIPFGKLRCLNNWPNTKSAIDDTAKDTEPNTCVYDFILRRSLIGNKNSQLHWLLSTLQVNRSNCLAEAILFFVEFPIGVDFPNTNPPFDLAILEDHFVGNECLPLVSGGEIPSTFDDPESVKLGYRDLIAKILIGGGHYLVGFVISCSSLLLDS